jgi:3-oxoacyl-(acyl-carrier-protein) synthase
MIYLTHARTICTEDTEVFDNIGYPQKVHWFPWSYHNVKTGLVSPPHKVGERVLDPAVMEAVKSKPGKTAFIFAAGSANFASEGKKISEPNHLSYKYKFLPLTMTNVYAGRVASMFGKIDTIATDSTACASSLKVLMDVQSLMKLYGYDRVIVYTVEDQVNNMSLEFFGESGASLTEKMAQEHDVVPSAFDSKNFGFHIGQGAALAVFEKDTHTTETPLAELVSAYTASESEVNAIGQREDGQGFVDAIRGSMHLANIRYSDITVVKTHGTGTKSNNQAERAALDKMLSKGGFVATSYKQRIGHTMGASGLLESILLLKDTHVPAILNRTEYDSTFLSESVIKPKGLMLSLAAGMGNVYSAAIFKQEM